MPDLKTILLEEPAFDLVWHQTFFSLVKSGKLESFIGRAASLPPDSQPLLDALLLVGRSYEPAGWVGALDDIEQGSIGGWIKRQDSDLSQFITLAINFTLSYECFLADSFRPDLKELFGGGGFYGFRLGLPPQKYPAPKFTFATLLEPFSSRIVAARFYAADS